LTPPPRRVRRALIRRPIVGPTNTDCSQHPLERAGAAALLIHVILIGDVGPETVLITLGFIARIPAIVAAA
ncbi:MAG: hypothetical protein GY925_02920, partial [Actinomycetia bacterium]|nr:hypothetical protein [Actinomycetes bacterium]